MTSLIKSELASPALSEAVETELNIFDTQFTELQPDGIGMSRMERALLRTYLIWKLHVRTEGSQPD